MIEMLPNSFFSLFREKRITGNAITPFMLERVKELTGGSSLEASIL
jgi:pseudouridine-5'-phosphate glycosidase